MLNILTVLLVIALLFAALLVVLVVVVVTAVAEATKKAAKQCEISVAWLRFHNLRNENEQAEKNTDLRLKNIVLLLLCHLI